MYVLRNKYQRQRTVEIRAKYTWDAKQECSTFQCANGILIKWESFNVREYVFASSLLAIRVHYYLTSFFVLVRTKMEFIPPTTVLALGNKENTHHLRASSTDFRRKHF